MLLSTLSKEKILSEFAIDEMPKGTLLKLYKWPLFCLCILMFYRPESQCHHFNSNNMDCAQ
ncbi:hypothetical protein DERP_002275 [Dermatophagoides pteronyssinus]|uniref:Uncharacterized protein n=1 Tax=Dermatophagoides pteronyssinus TaxID=6956 RepID=A0ABQ8JH91_DERPT|nr:hypothetical protein DERP_002275 [Dermatophagoides pteronyssinus]